MVCCFQLTDDKRYYARKEKEKQQVDAGIKPQKNQYWGQEFIDRKFAVMIEGSWLPVPFLQSQPEKNFEDRIGFIPTLPVPFSSLRYYCLL